MPLPLAHSSLTRTKRRWRALWPRWNGRSGFDRDRLIRATLLRDADARAWLCIVVHRIVADRRSLQLLARDW